MRKIIFTVLIFASALIQVKAQSVFTYAGNPLLSGIRFDDKAKSITVGSKIELLLPQDSNGVREKVVMNYRFDATITNAGCMLVVRDITYQNDQSPKSSLFPKTFTAEASIKSLRRTLRKVHCFT